MRRVHHDFPIRIAEAQRQLHPGAPRSLPWDMVAPHDRRARANHGASLVQLARRGGLEWGELLAVIEDRFNTGRYEVPTDEAVRRLTALLDRWLIAHPPF
jgi:hypothetical protein